jgi:hypothetical protein
MDILIFNFFNVFYMVRTREFIFSKDGSIYSCGMVRCTCTSISNLVGRTGFDITLGNVSTVGLYCTCIFTDLVLY